MTDIIKAILKINPQAQVSVNGTTTWKDAVAKVKSDNPKPE